jgi:hypothetical protein
MAGRVFARAPRGFNLGGEAVRRVREAVLAAGAKLKSDNVYALDWKTAHACLPFLAPTIRSAG